MRITCDVRWECGRMGMTLWSLETYGWIGSKTKSYQIQRGFFLLFIFLGHCAFWPYAIRFPLLLPPGLSVGSA